MAMFRLAKGWTSHGERDVKYTREKQALWPEITEESKGLSEWLKTNLVERGLPLFVLGQLGEHPPDS